MLESEEAMLDTEDAGLPGSDRGEEERGRWGLRIGIDIEEGGERR